MENSDSRASEYRQIVLRKLEEGPISSVDLVSIYGEEVMDGIRALLGEDLIAGSDQGGDNILYSLKNRPPENGENISAKTELMAMQRKISVVFARFPGTTLIRQRELLQDFDRMIPEAEKADQQMETDPQRLQEFTDALATVSQRLVDFEEAAERGLYAQDSIHAQNDLQKAVRTLFSTLLRLSTTEDETPSGLFSGVELPPELRKIKELFDRLQPGDRILVKERKITWQDHLDHFRRASMFNGEVSEEAVAAGTPWEHNRGFVQVIPPYEAKVTGKFPENVGWIVKVELSSGIPSMVAAIEIERIIESVN